MSASRIIRVAQPMRPSEHHDSDGRRPRRSGPRARDHLRRHRLVLIFALLFKFAGPLIKKGMAARTERRSRTSSTAATPTSAAADAEAAQIRQAKGDIDAERARILAEADAQAAALLARTGAPV